MFSTFLYHCGRCGHEAERFVRREMMDLQQCYECHDRVDPFDFVIMSRLPSAVRTTFKHADRSGLKSA